MPNSRDTWPNMPDPVRQTLGRYLVQLRKRLDAQIEAVILYGSVVRGEYVEGHSNINLLMVLQECTLQNLHNCSQLTERWKKEGIIPPLLITESELRQSCDLFPIEYIEIKENHTLLEGKDPFLTLHIDERGLMQHCARELSGNLLRLRQRFIEGQGRPEAIPAVLTLSLMALLPALRAVCKMLGHPSGGKSIDFLRSLPSALQVEAPVFLEILEIKQGIRTPGKLTMSDLFMRYAQAVENLYKQVRVMSQQEG